MKLVRSRFRDARPDIILLQALEDDALKCSDWEPLDGPRLFAPVSVSTRLFAFLERCMHGVLGLTKKPGAVLSLGLPYRHYLFGKTFPHFGQNYDVRALWTYDVWEPRFGEIEALIREAHIHLLMLSSYQATVHFRRARIPNCSIHWLPEFIQPERYHAKPWVKRSMDVLAFGRQSGTYHRAIESECRDRGIRYVSNPHFPTWQSLIDGLADTKICICFPRSLTHPQSAGGVETLTFRYLEGMAAKCLLIGQAPSEARKLLGYNPVVDVDWKDPVGQIQRILAQPQEHSPLIARNFSAVNGRFHIHAFVARVNKLVSRLEGTRRREQG